MNPITWIVSSLMKKVQTELVLLSFLPTLVFTGYVILLIFSQQISIITIIVFGLMFAASTLSYSILIRRLAMPLGDIRELLDSDRTLPDSGPLAGLSTAIGHNLSNLEDKFRTELAEIGNEKEHLSNLLQKRDQANQEIIDDVASRKLEPLQVLAVDDSIPNLQLLVLQLESLGFNVTTAKNGQEAVDLCMTKVFDFIFLDLQMPVMDGIEATRQICSAVVRQPKIIGLTAHITMAEQSDCLSAGMEEVLIKPVQTSTLRELTISSAKPPQPASKTIEETLFDRELSLSAANYRPELADELFTLLIANLPIDQESINRAFSDGKTEQLAEAVHKLLGSLRYCGVPRLENAVEKVANISKSGLDEDVRRALNVLNGEINTLILWSRKNPDPFNATSLD